MALLILTLLQRIFLMSSLMLLLVWLIFFMVLIKLLPILGTIPAFPTRRSADLGLRAVRQGANGRLYVLASAAPGRTAVHLPLDRKSTRLNSSHVAISYAVFCLKKKTKNQRYGSSHIDATAKDISNVVTDAASGVVDIFHGIDKAVADTWNYSRFPYTTLCRSRAARGPARGKRTAVRPGFGRARTYSRPFAPRSEEHTSELQSRGHLVCRLLLEKKNEESAVWLFSY